MQDVFFVDGDRQVYLQSSGNTPSATASRIHGYCLMTNPPAADLWS